MEAEPPIFDVNDEIRVKNQAVLMKNQHDVEHVRIFWTIITGLVAGILKVEGLVGFVLFLAAQIVVSGAICLVAMGGDANKYTGSSFLAFTFSTLGNHVLSFLLFWTLAHALVHIY